MLKKIIKEDVKTGSIEDITQKNRSEFKRSN